jgi:predicted transposase/invertase (TIGR01784 family)
MKTLTHGRFDPLNDFLFLKVMGEKGDEVQLLGFLNAVLGRTGDSSLSSLEILENKSFPADIIGDKSSIFDVRAMLRDGTMVNIEVQLRNLKNMDRRSLFYWSREFTRGLKAGQDYNVLPNTIAINIVNFRFLETNNFHTVFHIREDSDPSLVLTDALEIHFIDMVKYRQERKKGSRDDALSRWLAWLDVSSSAELVEEAVDMDEAIKAAEERMVYVTGDDEAIRAYEMRQMALADIVARRNFDREEGHAEGLAIGREEGLAEGLAIEKREIARKMMEMGIPAEQIQAITGLSPGIIETLRRN